MSYARKRRTLHLPITLSIVLMVLNIVLMVCWIVLLANWSAWSALTIGTVVRTVGAFRRGFRQGRTRGPALQQGGTLVVARSGAVLFRHISEGPGDNASVDTIVASLRN